MAEGFDIRRALTERYGGRNQKNGSEYALLWEVRNGVGFSGTTRTADAMAMSLWQSRGLEIHGIEIKAHRSDWLREKKNPAKAEQSIFRFCDRWWLAVSDENIVKDGELPPTWGLLVPKGKALVAKVEAPKLEAQPITRQFLGALLRKAVEVDATEADIARRVEEALPKREEQLKKDWEWQHSENVRLYAGLRDSVAKFEAASGVRISDRFGHDPGAVGAAVRLVLAGEDKNLRRRMGYLLETSKRITEQLEAGLAGLPAEESEREPDEVANG